ncbi:PQQ-binding-like beta-propeller repeat protein [Persicobacter psychrovividus]|uniref:Pyrrolo-quinoline quinone repeat domain-containing protein n=1 Tax=Persicobacter psychrovividus TaxID=387638 RepID=A0ABN6LBY2_9BACT|nr:hypothetical protein PEPS_30080 [Persicobacter psychrovividus]
MNYLSHRLALTLLGFSILFYSCSKDGDPLNDEENDQEEVTDINATLQGMEFSGFYHVGQPLGPEDYLKAYFYFKEPGSYNIVLNPGNGYQFTASGEVTSVPKLETIQLIGTGTPLNSQIDHFSFGDESPLKTVDIQVMPDNSEKLILISEETQHTGIKSTVLLDALNDNKVWEIDQSYDYGILHNSHLIVSSEAGIEALDAYTGLSVWQQGDLQSSEEMHMINDVLYVQTENDLFVAINPENGSIIWTVENYLREVYFQEDKIYLQKGDYSIFTIDYNGNFDQNILDEECSLVGVLGEVLVYYKNGDRQVIGYDLTKQEQVWHIDDIWYNNQINIIGNNLFVRLSDAFDGSYVKCYNGQSGNMDWEFSTNDDLNYQYLYEDEVLYLASLKNTVAINTANGEQLYQTNNGYISGLESTIIKDGETLYFGTINKLWAAAAPTGKVGNWYPKKDNIKIKNIYGVLPKK